MPISVTGPDNVTVSFPDGTDASIINDVMMKHFGGGQAQSKTSPITTGNLASAALDLPVVGPVARKADAAIQAAIAPYRSGNKGIMELSGESLPESGWGERYSHALKSIEAPLQKFEEEHPVAAGLANVAGTTAATLPLAATGAGARLLGLGGRTLGQQVARGAASGAGINAADAIARGNDPGVAGIVGGGIGGAVPVAGRLAGMAAEPIISTARGIVNPAGEAASRVASAVQRGQDLAALTPGHPGNPLTPQEFQAAQAAGAPVNIMDVAGEPGRRLARSAANTSAEGGQILNASLDSRYQAQSDRMADSVRSMMHYPDAVAQQRALEQSQSAANNVNYRNAMRDGDRSIWSPALERLASSPAVMEAMQRATKAVSNEAVIGGYAGMNPKFSFTPDGRLQPGRGPTGAPVYPNLQFWDATRQELSDAANQAEARQQTQAFRQLSLLSRQMNAALDTEVPSYAAARAGHEYFAGAQDALQAGRNFLTNTLDNREAATAKMAMSPMERQLFEDGFADSLIKGIQSKTDKSDVAAAFANSPINRTKLEIGLGSPQRARQFEAMVHLENVMTKARQAVQGNSTTARQLYEMGLAGGAIGGVGGYSYMSGDPTAIAHAALLYGAVRGRTAVNERLARQVAQLLTSNDLPRVQMAMQTLGANHGLLGNLRRLSTGLARSVSAQLQPNTSTQPQ